MGRTYIYARVSSGDQTTDNQLHEIRQAGYTATGKRVVTETISGSVCASERPGFARLLDRMESGDELVVSRMDRLGRSASDVTATVERLAAEGISVVCLQLGKMDLTSPAGKMTMGVLNHVAQFERDLLIERTQSGLARARAAGTKLGRRPALSAAKQAEALAKIAAGETIAQVARDFGVTRQIIMRIRDAAAA
ncbi:MAG: recombinase family protein [Paraburkholderia sp.]|uniref:recombinase family protein n=1 Tax=Paraburkholderia sp. TaxID=1926495 RepID=UPI00120CB9E9|nr:recombinase family protein [Paraburkholderia sp.]TAM06400.1 MAG: recombinase family protein [Paraburkholderia sp.]